MTAADPSMENQLNICFARLDILVGRHILGKKVDRNEELDSLKKIGMEFVVDFRQAVPSAVFDDKTLAGFIVETEPERDDKPSAKASSKPSQAKAKGKAQAGLSLYELDASGKAAGVGRLRAKGFDLGAHVGFASDTLGFSQDEIFAIKSVSATTVELQDACDSSKVRPIAIDEFLRSASHAKASDKKVKHSLWPASRACLSVAAGETFMRARVFHALEVLCRALGDRVCEQVDVFVKPSRSVVSKLDIPKGHLVLAPDTVKIAVVALGETIPAGHLEVIVSTPPVGFKGTPCLVPAASGEGVAPYAFVDLTTDAASCNMTLMYYKVQLIGGADPVASSRNSIAQSCSGAISKATGAPPASSAPVLAHALAREVAQASADVSISSAVYLPVLVNSIPLRQGDLLKALRDAAPQKRPPAPIMVSAVAKKAKLA